MGRLPPEQGAAGQRQESQAVQRRVFQLGRTLWPHDVAVLGLRRAGVVEPRRSGVFDRAVREEGLGISGFRDQGFRLAAWRNLRLRFRTPVPPDAVRGLFLLPPFRLPLCPCLNVTATLDSRLRDRSLPIPCANFLSSNDLSTCGGRCSEAGSAAARRSNNVGHRSVEDSQPPLLGHFTCIGS